MSEPGLSDTIPLLEFNLPRGKARTVGSPIQLDGEYSDARVPPPKLGQHTGEILDELRFSNLEAKQLLQDQAVFGR